MPACSIACHWVCFSSHLAAVIAHQSCLCSRTLALHACNCHNHAGAGQHKSGLCAQLYLSLGFLMEDQTFRSVVEVKLLPMISKMSAPRADELDEPGKRPKVGQLPCTIHEHFNCLACSAPQVNLLITSPAVAVPDSHIYRPHVHKACQIWPGHAIVRVNDYSLKRLCLISAMQRRLLQRRSSPI